MTVIVRTSLRPNFELISLTAIVLVQAAVLVWLGDRLSAGLAAVILTGGAVAFFFAPKASAQALAGIRDLNLQWWHWIWAMLFCSDFVFRIRDAQSIADDPLDGWALYRVALVGLAGFVLLWRLATRRGQWLGSMFAGLIPIMALYPLVGLLSTTWSIFPAWTAYKSIEFLTDIAVLAAVVAAAGDAIGLSTLLNWTWLLFAAVQCAVWIGAVVAPSRAFVRAGGILDTQITGLIPNISANGVGHIAAILSVVALSRLVRRGVGRNHSLLYWLVFLSSFGTLILAQTRSALLAFVAGAALILLLSRRIGLVLTLVFTVTILVLATGVESTVWTYIKRGQDDQLMGSLSGRTTWWSFAWARFLERPFNGYGAFAGGRFAALADLGDQMTSSVHNTYLEAILGIGAMGILPLIVCLLGTWWRIAQLFLSRAADAVHNIGLEVAGVLMVITVRSFFTTDLIWHPALPWLLALGFGELLRRQRRTAAA